MFGAGLWVHLNELHPLPPVSWGACTVGISRSSDQICQGGGQRRGRTSFLEEAIVELNQDETLSSRLTGLRNVPLQGERAQCMEVTPAGVSDCPVVPDPGVMSVRGRAARALRGTVCCGHSSQRAPESC